jgi:predicted transcriptional regulator
VKNVKSGLVARTKVLNFLDKQPSSAGVLAGNVGMSCDAVRHHLRLLESEGTVRRVGHRPCSWVLTGSGQKRLVP